VTGQGHRQREVPNETVHWQRLPLQRSTNQSRLQSLATAFWYTPSLANRPRIDDQPTFMARLDVLL
jgi:hypothetical protein